jgi:hypothetical protein
MKTSFLSISLPFLDPEHRFKLSNTLFFTICFTYFSGPTGGAASNRDSRGRGNTDGAVAQRRLPAQRSADPPLPAPVVPALSQSSLRMRQPLPPPPHNHLLRGRYVA